MAFYVVECPSCKREEEIFHPNPATWGEEMIPRCSCGEKREQVFRRVAGITFRSKGVFPYYDEHLQEPGLGDKGPVFVESYQDLQRKLKARGLRIMEPTKSNGYMTGRRWI